jgi:hypothetical protein
MKNADFKKMVRLLLTDWAFLQDFIANPHLVVSKFFLTDEEKHTLMARNVDDLMTLGVQKAPPCGIEEDL